MQLGRLVSEFRSLLARWSDVLRSWCRGLWLRGPCGNGRRRVVWCCRDDGLPASGAPLRTETAVAEAEPLAGYGVSIV